MSNESYNKQVLKFNKKLSLEKFELAEKSINQMQKNTIFNDFEVESRLKLLNIKLGFTSNFYKKNNYTISNNTSDVIINSLLIDRIYSSVLAQNILKKSIIENATSDSLIYIFEILKSKKLKFSLRKKIFTKAQLTSQWDKSEALQLLEIMKKNEKLIL